jgi:hypothetical protein
MSSPWCSGSVEWHHWYPIRPAWFDPGSDNITIACYSVGDNRSVNPFAASLITREPWWSSIHDLAH